MARIFLSHASKARSGVLARECYERLKHLHDVFLSKESISPASKWWAEIERNVDRSDCFVVFLCKGSVVSDWVVREVQRACQRTGNLPILPVRVALSKKLPETLAALDAVQDLRWKDDKDSDAIVRAIHERASKPASPPVKTMRLVVAGSHPWPALAGDHVDLMAASVQETSGTGPDGLLWIGNDECPAASVYSGSVLGLQKLVPGKNCLSGLEAVADELNTQRPDRVQIVVFAPMVHQGGVWYASGRRDNAVAGINLVEALTVLVGRTSVERAALLFHRSRSWPKLEGTLTDFPDDRALHQIEAALNGSATRWSCRLTGPDGEFRMHEADFIPHSDGFHPRSLAEILASSGALQTWTRGPLVLMSSASSRGRTWAQKLRSYAEALGLKVEDFDRRRAPKPGLLAVFDDADLLSERAGTIEGLAVVLLGVPWLDAGKEELRAHQPLRSESHVLELALELYDLARKAREGKLPPGAPQAKHLEEISGVCGRLIQYGHGRASTLLEAKGIAPRDPERTAALHQQQRDKRQFAPELVRELIASLGDEERAFLDDALGAELKRLLKCVRTLHDIPPEEEQGPGRQSEPRPVPIEVCVYDPGGRAEPKFVEQFVSQDVSLCFFEPAAATPSQRNAREHRSAVVLLDAAAHERDSAEPSLVWREAWQALSQASRQGVKLFVGMQNGATLPNDLAQLPEAQPSARSESASLDDLVLKLTARIRRWQAMLKPAG
jgi:hypothetical protein